MRHLSRRTRLMGSPCSASRKKIFKILESRLELIFFSIFFRFFVSDQDLLCFTFLHFLPLTDWPCYLHDLDSRGKKEDDVSNRHAESAISGLFHDRFPFPRYSSMTMVLRYISSNLFLLIHICLSIICLYLSVNLDISVSLFRKDPLRFFRLCILTV